MGSVARRILVVEDQRDLAHLVQLHLQDLGCHVETCGDGRAGLARALEDGPWNLLVLDIQLPGGVDGLEICRRVRGSATYVPILMLTARAGEYDRVLGLDTGADDYLTKPFSVIELTARVKAILRRIQHLAREAPGGAPRLRTVRRGPLEIDLDRRTARCAGADVELTRREFDLLAHLMLHPERVYTRAQLLDAVWGTTHDGFEHTVNSHINRLRAKIEPDPAVPRYVVTVWGQGYRLGDETLAGTGR